MAARAEPLLDFPVFFERDSASGYVVICPALPGCYSQGQTIDEAEENIREAILLCLEDMEANGEPLPQAGGHLIGHVTFPSRSWTTSPEQSARSVTLQS